MLSGGFLIKKKLPMFHSSNPKFKLVWNEQASWERGWHMLRMIRYNATDLCVMERKLSADREFETRIWPNNSDKLIS